ncbi:MAG: DUF3810 domain-containing protein [Anaerocolumna aminovalerica]|uniref:DUF3810 domain-containing protein n=1 Tax=Anaerocolumna aminovalerica TaxID=1527 RepID=UPI001C0E9BD1|nr:DUF3810 domain-containing protein [Anaerocolumna aminovalerica]MBU5333221.1 DUF3810 domain-containing protein [Anaerocolumna aminovalerica]MDU6264744.1 DUF3810 domain-containing protein [Anaerocolumna aminovalerica]
MKAYERGNKFYLLRHFSNVKDNLEKKRPVKWHNILQKKRIWILILIPVALVVLFLARVNPWIAEYIFARGIYKQLAQVFSLMAGIVPFSIMEAQVILLPILAAILFLRFLWRIISRIYKKESDLGYIIAHGLLNGACIFSIALFLYVIFAGVNYHRYSFAAYSGLEVKESSVEELYNLNVALAKNASDIRNTLHLEGAEDENGVIQFSSDNWGELGVEAAKAFDKAAEKYPVLKGKYGTPKPVFFSRFMSRMEITGIYWPFTLEANINVDTTKHSIPATMGHELAHLRGFMREDEANFIAYLVCKESDNLLFQYSGAMLALSYVSNQLYKENSELYYKVADLYSPYMIADLREEYYYWNQFEDTVISTISNSMNDTYLKANRQEDGVKSYGRMVDLLLAEYRASKEMVN